MTATAAKIIMRAQKFWCMMFSSNETEANAAKAQLQKLLNENGVNPVEISFYPRTAKHLTNDVLDLIDLVRAEERKTAGLVIERDTAEDKKTEAEAARDNAEAELARAREAHAASEAKLADAEKKQAE